MAFPAGPAGPGNRWPLRPRRGRPGGAPRPWSPLPRGGAPGGRAARIPGPCAHGAVGRAGLGAAGRQESSWIRESCWRASRSPPAGHRLPGDLGPATPASRLSFLGHGDRSEISLDHELPGGVDFQEMGWRSIPVRRCVLEWGAAPSPPPGPRLSEQVCGDRGGVGAGGQPVLGLLMIHPPACPCRIPGLGAGTSPSPTVVANTEVGAGSWRRVCSVAW